MQSTDLSLRLPACIALLAALWSSSPLQLSAQTKYRVTRSGEFQDESGDKGKVLATIPEGAEVLGSQPRGGWVQVELIGWVWGESVGKSDRKGFDLEVTSSRGENLRQTQNGAVLAKLQEGFLLDQIARDGDWVRVRRKGWVLARVLEDPDKPKPPAESANDGTPAMDRAITSRPTELDRLPDSLSIGTVAAETPVKILSRSGEWARVQIEGWVKEADLRPGAGGILVGVSGSEVRARPRDFEGKLLQWTVQYLSLPIADELRPEIPAGERYMLARGPMPEVGFVYLTLTPAQTQQVQRLPPLAEVIVVARVRHGRSAYVGNPVVELVDLTVKRP